ncbi:MAG: hypothetical protein OXM55_05040 [Bdellovibrionales bacterium]|nr:hypothetical protein [Bdellovibrionales bacterium]
MFIFTSPQIRLIYAFYLPILFMLLYYLREQTLMLLEYNSANWYINLYKTPVFQGRFKV